MDPADVFEAAAFVGIDLLYHTVEADDRRVAGLKGQLHFLPKRSSESSPSILFVEHEEGHPTGAVRIRESDHSAFRLCGVFRNKHKPFLAIISDPKMGDGIVRISILERISASGYNSLAGSGSLGMSYPSKFLHQRPPKR